MSDSAARPLVEICVVDVEGALAAECGGANRIELCADIAQGGTTPSIGVVAATLARLHRADLQVMIRPRGGDFTLTATELDAALADVAAVRALPNPNRRRVGFVFGVLTDERTLDEIAMRRLREACGDAPCTLHKAVDVAADLTATALAARDLGMSRVLTSGGAATALEGAIALRSLSAELAESATVIVAGGVRPHNVREVVAATGAREIHLRAPMQRAGAESTSSQVVADVVEELERS